MLKEKKKGFKRKGKDSQHCGTHLKKGKGGQSGRQTVDYYWGGGNGRLEEENPRLKERMKSNKSERIQRKRKGPQMEEQTRSKMREKFTQGGEVWERSKRCSLRGQIRRFHFGGGGWGCRV